MVGLMVGLLLRHPAAVVLCLIVGGVVGHLFFDASHVPPPRHLENEDAEDFEDPESTPVPRVRPRPRGPLSSEALDTQAQEHFARHLCALLMEVARADGEVVRDEVRVAREYFEHELKYGPEALDVVRRNLKDFLRQPPSVEASTAACREQMPTAERLLLLDVLYQLALADGGLQRAEQDALRRIAKGLELKDEQVRAIAARHLGTGDAHYARLGLVPEASDAEVKRAFRNLAAAHHPDKVAHLGPGAMEQATRRFREIKDAYEEIRRLRGL